MKVLDFVNEFKNKRIMNTKTEPNVVSNYIKNTLEVKEYVSFLEKQSIAQVVLESCAKLENGVISIDSIQKYIIFTITILSTYTNLEFEGSEIDLDAYDSLCSYSIGDITLLDAIVKTFEKEYSRCNDILNLMTADLMAENNVEKQVGKFLSGISANVDSISNALKDKVENSDIDFNQLDIDKLSNIISKIK